MNSTLICSPAPSETYTIVTEFFGYLAALLLITSLLAQVRLNYLSKLANLSYIFIGFQVTVHSLFLTYNASISSWPTSIGNGSTIILMFVMLGQKIYYDRRMETKADLIFDVEGQELVELPDKFQN